MAKEDLTQVKLSSSLLSDTYTICGVVLKPLCLGHIVLLEALKNPMVAEEPVDVEMSEGLCHFFLSLIICSLSFEDGLKLLNEGQLFKDVCREFCDNLSENMKADKEWNIHNKVYLFKRYMSEQLESMPYYNETQSKTDIGTPSGNDWKSSIMIIFIKLGYTNSEILNMPIRTLFSIWTSWAESEGQIKVCNKYEAETLKQFSRK